MIFENSLIENQEEWFCNNTRYW